MRLLRFIAVQRLVCAGLLASLGLWLAAPALGATAPRTAALADLDVPPTVRAAFEQALDEAAGEGARTPEAFAAAFARVLDTQHDADLARFVEAQPPEALFTLLYGQWVRALHHAGGLEAAPAPPVTTPTGASSAAASATLRGGEGLALAAVSTALPDTGAPPVPFAVQSAAQPLGP